jgi:UDPglucose--hexose-1-phosphate uridylyltransferase
MTDLDVEAAAPENQATAAEGVVLTPEFRLDELTRQWVAITGTRQNRPNLPAPDACPFCVGGLEAEHPYVVKAFPNRWPPMAPGDPVDFASDRLVRDARPARGAAEVILYSPEHEGSFATLSAVQSRAVIDLWADRTAALLARPEIEYVLVFENNGAEVGATIGHPHGQIYAFPFLPPVPALEAQVASRWGCPICAELERGHELDARTVQTNGSVTAFTRYAAGWPFELIVTPTQHVADIAELEGWQRDDFALALRGVLSRYRQLFDEPLPYMFWLHPGVHLHAHLVTTRRQANTIRYVAAGEVGSGVMFNPVSPEVAARQLRGVEVDLG